MVDNKDVFHHALRFNREACIGCSHCMATCPTEAITVMDGHPVLDPNRCIDCGKCYSVCPVGAIEVEQDDFQTIYNYKYPILILPSIFSAQFPDKVNQESIYSALYELGFYRVFEIEKSVDIIVKSLKEKIKNNTTGEPLISTFCPAVVRLIQVKFPSLVGNLVCSRPPLDLTALYVKKRFAEKGLPVDQIGVFYVTPCAAKIAAVKSPVSEDKSPIDGVINMNYLFNKVYRVIKQSGSMVLEDNQTFQKLTKDNLMFTLTGGEIKNLNTGKSLAIDEIHNVAEFLEKLENEEIEGLDFLELRACDESCAGGILCAGNRFMVSSRQRNRADASPETLTDAENVLLQYEDYLTENLYVPEVKPRSMLKLDNDMAKAMVKMKRINELIQVLPKVDCRICGYASCQALAEAIVKDKAQLKQCIFIQRVLERDEVLTFEESILLMKKIWGDIKADKNTIINMTDTIL